MREDKNRNNARSKHGLILESKEFSLIIVELERNSVQYMESIIYNYIVEEFVQFVIFTRVVCLSETVYRLFYLNTGITDKMKSSFIRFP